ncbi:MAG: sigma 54-interacting transcriptional regulator [Gammaproteobacteria bacterium]
MSSKPSVKQIPTVFELQSLVDSHQHPFVVIDREYKILAVNKAYEKTYGVGKARKIGLPCYKISHDKDAPCCRSGEDCPHEYLFSHGEPHSCIQIHYDEQRRMHQVRVTAHPLRSGSGELFMGELIEPLTAFEEIKADCNRMVGQARTFTACMEQLKLVAATAAPVLLQGETGTGKELAASFIHEHSPRREDPFLTVDCTSLTDTLFEAEVFGHARGAYTGSVGEKAGLFEQADGGTLFLDEVGELPMNQQAKLLRILETGQFRRVGGRGNRKVDVRVICASNRHLWEAVQASTFREDLYYRIACLTVRLPNLRERLEDIPALANSLLEPVNLTMRRRHVLAPDALDRLKTYHYPGNIRELRNILYVAATHSSDATIHAGVIDTVIGQMTRNQASPNPSADESTTPPAPAEFYVGPLQKRVNGNGSSSLVDVEARHIRELLDRYAGNRREVASALGISERTLYRKLRKFELS